MFQLLPQLCEIVGIRLRNFVEVLVEQVFR